MATHAGSEGLIYIGSNPVAEVKSYSLDIVSDTTDASIIGTSWRKNQATIKSWSGSLEAFWDETDTDGQGSLVIGSTVTLNLYPEGNDTGDTFYTGDAIITNKSISGAFDGIVEASFTFTGTGPLTETTVS